jgi:hypothetical protein
MLHISLARSVAFLLQEQPLDDAEHGHLIRCNQCQQAMADAGLEELLKTTQTPRNYKSRAGVSAAAQKIPVVLQSDRTVGS